MESDDDLIFSEPAEAVQSPIQRTKLKRLKKASDVSRTPAVESPLSPKSLAGDGREHLIEERPVSSIGSPSPIVETLNASGLVTDSHSTDETNTIEENSVRSPLSLPGSDSFESEAGRHVNVGFPDDLEASSQDGQVKLRSFDDCTTETQEQSDHGCMASGENADCPEKTSAKKRGSMDGDDEKHKRKKKLKNADADSYPEAPNRTKRGSAKERKSYLDMLHAESQRLLRETRDASFRPAPVVQKPISSVLEKIRQRKLEVLKKSKTSDFSDSFMNNDASLGNMVECGLHTAKSDKRPDGGNDDKDYGLPVPIINVEDGMIAAPGDILTRSVSGNKGEHETRDSISDALVQEHSIHSQSDSKDNQLEDASSEPLKEDSKDNLLEDDSDKLCEEEFFSPSILAKLKEESVLSENNSSEGEDDDKENLDPHPGGDPVKAFVDDEAEEEDDSDHELMVDDGSSEENEEKETGEYEEFKDLIVSGYEEKAVDTERRDELHQKWLQQQDAAETENILQRLKCGVQQKAEERLLHDEEEYEQCDLGLLDEEMLDLPSTSGNRIKTKELKLMISKMFTDCEDPFLSDDEENETRLARQLYHNKSEETASFMSPEENESSREVFGLIKKLNIAPENKKRTKASSFLETLVKGSNSSGSSKSSFLGRAHSSSLPSARKQGVSTGRSFVFGRDDSNSRSGISTSAESTNLNRKEKQQPRKSFVKPSSTQSKTSTEEARKETQTASGPSLFQILRASSIHSSGNVYSEKESRTIVSGETQAESHFIAFKSSRKTTKVET